MLRAGRQNALEWMYSPVQKKWRTGFLDATQTPQSWRSQASRKLKRGDADARKEAKQRGEKDKDGKPREGRSARPKTRGLDLIDKLDVTGIYGQGSKDSKDVWGI